MIQVPLGLRSSHFCGCHVLSQLSLLCCHQLSHILVETTSNHIKWCFFLNPSLPLHFEARSYCIAQACMKPLTESTLVFSFPIAGIRGIQQHARSSSVCVVLGKEARLPRSSPAEPSPGPSSASLKILSPVVVPWKLFIEANASAYTSQSAWTSKGTAGHQSGPCV